MSVFNKNQQDKSGSSLSTVLAEAGPGLASSDSPATTAAPSSALSAATSYAPRSTAPKAASLIAEDIAIEGNLKSEGELQADGTIRGDVSVARLTIGESGQIDGSVHADSVEVRGKVTGSITAKQVRLYASSRVEGDITHEQLTIEAGAFFEGRSLRLQRATIPVGKGGGDVIDISAAS
jgi:cytoskeletal protein CcmA (bactofilin family)